MDLLYNKLCNKIHDYNLQLIESRTTSLQQIHNTMTCRDVVQQIDAYDKSTTSVQQTYNKSNTVQQVRNIPQTT